MFVWAKHMAKPASLSPEVTDECIAGLQCRVTELNEP